MIVRESVVVGAREAGRRASAVVASVDAELTSSGDVGGVVVERADVDASQSGVVAEAAAVGLDWTDLNA